MLFTKDWDFKKKIPLRYKGILDGWIHFHHQIWHSSWSWRGPCWHSSAMFVCPAVDCRYCAHSPQHPHKPCTFHKNPLPQKLNIQSSCDHALIRDDLTQAPCSWALLGLLLSQGLQGSGKVGSLSLALAINSATLRPPELLKSILRLNRIAPFTYQSPMTFSHLSPSHTQSQGSQRRIFFRLSV